MSRETGNSPAINQQKGDAQRTNDTQQDRNEHQQNVEDISKIDRQEGEMNNGELGGDFNETKNNPASKK